MPRDHLRPEELAEPAGETARDRLEAQLKRAVWAQRASRSWADFAAAQAPQPNR